MKWLFKIGEVFRKKKRIQYVVEMPEEVDPGIEYILCEYEEY